MAKRYVPRHPDYAHQKEGKRRLRLQQEYFALLMAMRTGKTKVTIDNFGELELAEKVNDICVIAPAGAYKTWPDQFNEHLSDDLRQRLDVHLWEAGANTKTDLHIRKNFMDPTDRPRALIINTEALSSVERARDLCLSFLRQRRNVTAVDESTDIKNPESERGSFVIDKVRPLATYRRILSGLPTPNSPFDLFSQFYFLNPDVLGWSYANYKATYAILHDVCYAPNELLIHKLKKAMLRMPPNLRSADGTKYKLEGMGMVEPEDLSRAHILSELKRLKVYVQTVELVKEYRNEDQLNKLIKPYSYRVLLSDTYDMPPKVYMKREVTLHPEQKRIYNDLKLKSMAELESEDFVTPNMVITRLLRMHQVLCGHVVDDEGKDHEIPENRTKEILKVLEDYDGKAIIWCSYDYSVRKVAEAIAKVYGPESVARFWGGNSKTREQEEKQFKNNPKCRFNVATPAAGGRSRTWSVANLLIYYSSTNNLEHRAQSEERGDAVGKKDTITAMDLIAPGTVDEKIIMSLRRKIDMSNAITGDNWRQWLV